MNKFEVSVIAEEPSDSLTVLKVATASRNTSTQLYSTRVQISLANLEDLDKKLRYKLALHRVQEVDSDVTLRFANDRIEDFRDFQDLLRYDLKVASRTESLSIKWRFVFQGKEDGAEQLHSIYIRFADMPAPGVLLQKMLSARADEVDSIEPDLFSPVVCKLDFADSRFSSELFAVVDDWLKAQPRIEPTFAFVLKLGRHSDKVKRFVENSLPTLALLAYVGIWLGLLPQSISDSTKYAVAWMIGGGALFLLARYLAGALGRVLETNIRRVTLAPTFQLTAGDNNRITSYLAKSQKSAITIAATGLLYGVSQAVGLYLASKILTHLF